MTDKAAGGRALDTLTHATEQAEEAVSTASDGREAFRLATELTDAFHQAAERVAQLRGQAARRTRDQEALTLRALADRIGVSKSRADQLVKEADRHG
jgi:DNA-directed RNA polymerase sigma subunit (sigma70/sigma32)